MEAVALIIYSLNQWAFALEAAGELLVFAVVATDELEVAVEIFEGLKFFWSFQIDFEEEIE